MKDIKWPFSAFDYFSNIIPAIIFFVGILLLRTCSDSIAGKLDTISDMIFTIESGAKQMYLYSFVMLASIAIIFSMGHALMAAGSLILDRLLIGKAIGYPYIRLFNLNQSDWQKFSETLYLSMFSLIIIYTPWLLWIARKTIVLYIFAGHFALAVAIKLAASTWRNIVKRLNERQEEGALTVNMRWYERVIVWVSSKAPSMRTVEWIINIVFTGFVIKGILHAITSIFRMKEFKKEFIVNFKALFKKKFKLDIDSIENTDASVFWLAYVDIHEKRPNAAQALHSVRSLFYFSRNLCMALLMLLTICIYFQFYDGYNEKLAAMGTIYLAGGIVFFVHYYNIYFTYYSKQTFRIFYAHNIEERANPVLYGVGLQQ